MSAAPGDLVGPLSRSATAAAAGCSPRVRDKLVPTLDDPDIRARAEQAAVGAAVQPRRRASR